MLRTAPAGMTKTDLNHHFGRNKPASEIDRALLVLAKHGLVNSYKHETRGHRPTRGAVVCRDANERNEFNERRVVRCGCGVILFHSSIFVLEMAP
jgi:hypothetical protein